MQTKNFLGLKICEINEEEKDSNFSDYDLVELSNVDSNFGFVKPQKVSWRAYVKNTDDIYQVIKSKKLRKLIKKWESELEDKNIKVLVKENLSEKDFLEWLQSYRKNISDKEKGDIKLDESWYQEKVNKKEKVWGVFFYKEHLLGGNIGTFAENMLKISFGILDQIEDSNLNLGALLDFKTIRFGVSKNYKVISFGQDTNLYGYHLSSGLFYYKARLGLTPEPVKKYGFVTLKFINLNKFETPILFLTGQDKLTLSVIISDESEKEKIYLPNEVSEVKFYIKSDIL